MRVQAVQAALESGTAVTISVKAVIRGHNWLLPDGKDRKDRF
jgi:hypothetical protein